MFIFTNLYDDESQELGITKDMSLEVLHNPDKIQEMKFEDLFLQLIMKKEPYGDSYLIILTKVIDEKQHLLLPFRVFPDLFPNIEILEPLMILQLLAQKYGLVLKIGSEQRRFIYRAKVTIAENREEIIKIINPKNHPFLRCVFVKIIKSDERIVVECALAFCIDKKQYKNWLSSEHKKKLPQKNMKITQIVPPGIVNLIIKNSGKYKDKKKRFIIIEIGLSLEIIRRIMGENWYRKVLRQFKPGEKIKNREYRRLVGNNDVHPLSEALWSEKPKQFIRLIHLAHFLNQLWHPDDSNNLQEKIKELRQHSFIHTFYELKIASYFDRRELPVTFINKVKGEKTPEFRIDSQDGYAFCECKRKDSPSIEIDSLLEDAVAQIENYGGPGIIFIEIPTMLDEKSVDTIRERALELLIYKEMISLFILTHEYFRDEFETIVAGTKVYGVFNENAKFSLPEKIKQAALFQEPIEWFPLSQTLSS